MGAARAGPVAAPLRQGQPVQLQKYDDSAVFPSLAAPQPAARRRGIGRETDGLAKVKDDVVFRGTRNGVLMVLNDQTDYAVLKQRISERLAAAENFFYPGAGVTLDVGSRVLTTAQLLDLEELLQRPHGLKLINVIHSSPSASGAADTAGGEPREPAPAASAATPRQSPPRQTPQRPAPQPSAAPPLGAVASAAASPAPSAAPSASAAPAPAAVADSETILVKRTLRSGQRIRHNGNVVILGEVNPGAEVVAAGDIVVMGALRGVAHAGAGGREDAIVVAFRLQPTQLRIAGYIARAPEGAEAPQVPELARVKDGAIIIEADPHRFF